MSSCKYCDGRGAEFGDRFCIKMDWDGRGTLVNDYFSGEYYDVEAEILFCPMCGRKLE